MASTDDADAALAAVLSGIPAPDEQNSAPAAEATPDALLDLADGVLAPVDLADGRVPEAEWLIAPDEAQALVESARAALEQFDNAITQIVATRAWEPLGYSDPRAFVLAEFGPSKDDPDNPARVSRSHAYRLARVATFAYGLAQILGTDAEFGLSATEYALRQLPAEEDLRLIARVEDRVGSLDHTPNQDEVQAILDEELARARDAYARGTTPDYDEDDDRDDAWSDLGGGRGSGGEAPDGGWGYADAGDLADRLAGLDLPDPVSSKDDDGEVAQQAGVDNSSLSALTPGRAPTTDEFMESSVRYRDLLAALTQIHSIHEYLPELIDQASEVELDHIAVTARTTLETCQALIQAVDEA